MHSAGHLSDSAGASAVTSCGAHQHDEQKERARNPPAKSTHHASAVLPWHASPRFVLVIAGHFRAAACQAHGTCEARLGVEQGGAFFGQRRSPFLLGATRRRMCSCAAAA